MVGTRQLLENCSAIQLQTGGLGFVKAEAPMGVAGASTFSLISLSYLVFVYFLVLCCLREQSGKQTPCTRFRRCTTSSNGSTKRSLVFCRIFLTAFPFEKDSSQHSLSFSCTCWYSWIHVRRLMRMKTRTDMTRKNEEDNVVGKDKKSVAIAACACLPKAFALHRTWNWTWPYGSLHSHNRKGLQSPFSVNDCSSCWKSRLQSYWVHC